MAGFNINQPPGSNIVVDINVPPSAGWATLEIDATPIPSVLTAIFIWNLSRNNGQTFTEQSKISLDGKTAQIGHGQPPIYHFGTLLPGIGTGGRKIQGVLNVQGATLVTMADLTFSANNPDPD